MCFLILAHSGDETAVQVYEALKGRHGSGLVTLVYDEELIHAPRWVHRLDSEHITTDISLRGGQELHSESLEAVFNRLRYIEVPLFEASTPANRDYAVMEVFALWLSWLASLPCPVVNRPTPRGIGLQIRSHAEWLFLAGKAGLPAQGYYFTSNANRFRKKSHQPYRPLLSTESSQTSIFQEIPECMVDRQPVCYLEPMQEQQESVLVIGQNVIGPLARLYARQLRQFADIVGCELLKITFAQPAAREKKQKDNQKWKVCAINPFPELQDDHSVNLVCELLEAKRGMQ